ncbi:lycopene cyclase family protein [Streptomyces sp. 21So2-11]|uniref:lycopene cyclase family protein n=1 Tax=Streptomyces sp. 21So2-11 TaxID=3144408 RepID=UPI00321918A8
MTSASGASGADVIIVGAGAAGLSLAHHLAAAGGRGGTTPTMVVVEAPDGPLRPPERTWCFWEEGDGAYKEAVVASWSRLRVRAADGRAVEGEAGPLRYKMIRSGGFERLVDKRLAACPEVRRVRATVDVVRDVAAGAEVLCTTAGGERLTLRGRWVFDSRPLRRLPPARSTLVQHFRGWFVHTERPEFTPSVADLMDFRTEQPAHGLSFGYVLPLGPQDALVEYTEFSAAPLTGPMYEQALRHYTRDVLGLGALRIVSTEQGAIPMTDAVFPRRVGASVFRIGTAGGATRPATGYTFAAVQRQSRAIAAAHRRGRVPVPPPAHPARARAMDAVMLRALDTGRVDGADFFTGLFGRTPMERMLRFLDGRTRVWEDIAIGLRTPVGPMLRTVAELPLLPRREQRP